MENCTDCGNQAEVKVVVSSIQDPDRTFYMSFCADCAVKALGELECLTPPKERP